MKIKNVYFTLIIYLFVFYFSAGCLVYLFILLFSFHLFIHFFTCLLYRSIYVLTQLWFLRWVHAHAKQNTYSAHFCSRCCTTAVTRPLRTSFSTPITQSYMIQIPSVLSYTGIFLWIEHIVNTFSNAVVDRLGMRFGVSLIGSELVRGTLSEPVGCSSVSHSVSRLVNRRVCMCVSHRQSIGKSFGQFRSQSLNQSTGGHSVTESVHPSVIWSFSLFGVLKFQFCLH